MPTSLVTKLIDVQPKSVNILGRHPIKHEHSTPLLLAFGKYNEDYVDLLLSRGAQVNDNFVQRSRYVRCTSLTDAATFQRLFVKSMRHFNDPHISKAELPFYLIIMEDKFDIRLFEKGRALPGSPLTA